MRTCVRDDERTEETAMSAAHEHSETRRLRPAESLPPTDPDALATAILACLGAAPAGVSPRALRGCVAERLALPAAAVPQRALEVALGLLVVGGRVDEADGRLVAVSEERRRAG
jgi:hypothetical protein